MIEATNSKAQGRERTDPVQLTAKAPHRSEIGALANRLETVYLGIHSARREAQ